jgi:hypothetical protein
MTETAPPEGVYIWTVAVERAEHRDKEREKPYILLGCKIIEDEYAGFAFDYRLYINPKARNWALYFLRKFDYASDLCDAGTIRLPKIIGLTGKMLVEVGHWDSGKIRIDSRAFDHLGGNELEERLAKLQPEQTVDVESDKEQNFDWLDNA